MPSSLITPDGRYYLAGLFGEDGMVLLDLWYPQLGTRRILPGYGRGEEPLPVYKMPHLEGRAVASDRAFVPAVGHHAVLVIDMQTWAELGRIPVAGQPVFVMARPDGRQVWINFALPDNHLSVAKALGIEESEVIARLTRLTDSGTISRVGPVFRPTGLEVLDLPMLAEYHINLGFPLQWS